MPANSKTYLREKCFAVPKEAFSGPRSPSYTPNSLRHAIYLNFRMTSKKHLLLGSSIRVVVSPRPVEHDEYMRTTTEGPTMPKYIPWDGSTFSPNGNPFADYLPNTPVLEGINNR
jgi:hypothetical protein